MAAPANSAVATGRQQRIVVEQASSAAARIAAELEVAAAPFKESEAAAAPRGALASVEARAGEAVEVVADPAADAGKNVSSVE